MPPRSIGQREKRRARPMSFARSDRDVDGAEESELRRLENGSSDATGDCSPMYSGAASRGAGQGLAAARATSTGEEQADQIADGQAEARQTLVSGYAEHRASLSEKKKYRRAIKIDLKLPEASTEMAMVRTATAGPARFGRIDELGSVLRSGWPTVWVQNLT